MEYLVAVACLFFRVNFHEAVVFVEKLAGFTVQGTNRLMVIFICIE